jgi:hypothetical protein
MLLPMRLKLFEVRRIENKTARGQALGNEGCVLAQQLDIKHGYQVIARKAPFSPIAAAIG